MKLTTAHIIHQAIAQLPFIALLILVALLPFPYGWGHRVTLYLLGILYPLDYIVNRRWKGWRWSRKRWVYVAFIAFFLLIPIWQLFDPLQTALYKFTLEHYAPFAVIGIIGILGTTNTLRLDYTGWVMLAVSAAIVGYVCLMTGTDVPNLGHWVEVFNDTRSALINSHMVLNLYLNLALIMGAMIIIDTSHGWPVRLLTALLMLPSVFALVITEGRTGLLTFILISFAFLVYYSVKHRHWWGIVVIALFVTGATALLQNNERMERGRVANNPRLYIWMVAEEMISERPWSGYGVCTARDEFVKRGLDDEQFRSHYSNNMSKGIADNSRDDIPYEEMHPHNVLLETWTQFGIIGVVLWILCMGLPFFMRLGARQLYLDFSVCAFGIQACFESLGTHLQPMYLCLIVLLFHYATPKPKADEFRKA